MNRKPILWLLPAAIAPYLYIGAECTVFLGSKIIEVVFDGNALWLVFTVAIVIVAALLFSAIGAITSYRKRWDAASLAKAVMIVKCIQIPAYVIIFVIGALGMIAPIFLFPVLLMAAIADACFIAMTGAFGIAAAVNTKREGLCTTLYAVCMAILSCVYCADVVAAILLVRQASSPSHRLEESAHECPCE